MRSVGPWNGKLFIVQFTYYLVGFIIFLGYTWYVFNISRFCPVSLARAGDYSVVFVK